MSKLQKIAVVFLLVAVATWALHKAGGILCAGTDGADAVWL